MKQSSWFSALGFAVFCLSWSTLANAKTLYVAKNGSDKGNTCATASSPCLTIASGVSHMAGGDTLTIGDGTYAEQIVRMPDGSASAYTTIQATNDWGVTIDGSGFADNYLDGIRVSAKYVAIRGFHVKMNQAHPTNLGINVFSSSHVKIQRCSAAYSGTTGNVAGINVGPASDYALVEESYVYGGARYPFLVYQSTHTVVRRCVSRIDYWNGSLQAANFTNYNGDMTVWENNIAIDSDTASTGASSGLFGGFFNENKVPDSSWSGTATRETHRGNIVLNVNAKYSGIYDYDISNLHTYSDDIVWDSHGGYYGDYVHGDAPVLNASNLTVGKILGTFDAPDGQGSAGTGFYLGPGTGGTMIKDTVTDSIFWENPSFGIAADVSGDYNSYWSNGANYGGTPKPAAGAHDLTSDVSAGLKYLPRIEAGSMLATAGSGGGQVGASVVFEWGTTGTLWGDPGYDTITADPLWPFPNEAVIKADMAGYTGSGAAGARGFTTGNSKDGTPQTLTKYIWEYLGNQIPPEIYGFHIVTATLPSGKVGVAYQASLEASGGTAPYKWSMTGMLPPGLTFDGTAGTISGTPTMAVTETLGLTATDSASPALMATVSVQLQILPAVQATDAGGDDAGEVVSGGDGGVKPSSKMSSGGGGGGCGCRTASRGSGPIGLGALCGATGLFLVRRRRRAEK
ncbi:MAG: putative Ig domain-containing protein [Polyangiaceae bacterium]